MRPSRRLMLVAAVTGAALVAPAAASAHVANVEYKFPLPIWLYALAGGLAVLVSAPAAALAVRGRSDRTSRDFYPAVARFHLGTVGLLVASLLLIVGLLGGAFGDPISFTANPLTLLVWVDFWVGLGLVSALVGNVWDFVSPLSWAGRALDRGFSRRGLAARHYPDWLGLWPSVLLLLGWSWAELVWSHGDRARDLLALVVAYLFLQLLAIAVFGAERGLAHGELFTVFARTLARFAPVELYVRSPEGECPAGRCAAEGERTGCPACWLAAQREDRGLRLRPYGSGVRREGALPAGGGAFVVATLATVVFDGYHSTSAYSTAVDRLFPHQPAGSEAVGTLAMIVIVAAFVLAYLVVCAVVSRYEERDPFATAARYAPALIPIAAVYFIAHYFLYWFYIGQLTPGTIADPFEREWVADYQPWSGIPGAAVWWLQVGLIVWGHVVAVLEAHRISLERHRQPRVALATQLPLVLLMVGYTFSGLWVLGQSLHTS